VISEPDTEGESETTLDERVASAHLLDGSQSAQLIEPVGWAVHDADETETKSMVCAVVRVGASDPICHSADHGA
jgi:hypothetical protein